MGAASSRAATRDARKGLAVFIAWGVVYSGARLAMEALPQESSWRVPVAFLPTPFFLGVLWNLRQQAAAVDELQRRIQLEALAIAFPLALMMMMVLGLLELATDLNPQDWSYRHIWPFFVGFYFMGLWIANRRYG